MSQKCQLAKNWLHRVWRQEYPGFSFQGCRNQGRGKVSLDNGCVPAKMSTNKTENQTDSGRHWEAPSQKKDQEKRELSSSHSIKDGQRYLCVIPATSCTPQSQTWHMWALFLCKYRLVGLKKAPVCLRITLIHWKPLSTHSLWLDSGNLTNTRLCEVRSWGSNRRKPQSGFYSAVFSPFEWDHRSCEEARQAPRDPEPAQLEARVHKIKRTAHRASVKGPAPPSSCEGSVPWPLKGFTSFRLLLFPTTSPGLAEISILIGQIRKRRFPEGLVESGRR